MSMADCYESRYAKIAQTMRDIDRIADALVEQIEGDERLRGAKPLVARVRSICEGGDGDDAHGSGDLRRVARIRRMRRATARISPPAPVPSDEIVQRRIEDGLRLLHEGKSLLTYLAGARVPMPKSTREFLDLCRRYEERRPLGP